METHLGLEEKVTCHLCGEKFKTGLLKKHHIREVHKGIETFPCPHCPKKFTESNLQVHINSQHGGGFQCDKCGVVYKNKHTALLHKRMYKKSGEDCREKGRWRGRPRKSVETDRDRDYGEEFFG